MTLDWRPADARREVVRLCHAGLDPDTLRNSVIGQLHRVLEFDAWCWTTADPATGLITGATGRNLPAAKTQRFFEIEYVEPDFTKWSELARRRVPVGALGRATGGRFERSARFREIFGPAGIGEDLRAALTIGGSTWGYLGLHRDPARPFGDHEAAYLAGLTRHLAEGLRTALLLGGLDLDDDAGPGVLLVGDDLRVRSVSPRAVELMAEIRTRRSAGQGPLLDAGVEGDGVIVPDAVAAVVALLLRLERGDAEGADDAEGANGSGPVGSPAMPRARVPTRAGGWVVVHATRLSGTHATPGDHGTAEPSPIAVVLEPARRHELMPLVLEAYELTPRESAVTRLVLLGYPTRRIGEELGISPLTVQQHLKGVFDKVGVRSKRELAATIFSTHYWPRVASAAPIGANGQFGPEESS